MSDDHRPEPVATGTRREDVRMEADPKQLVRMRATHPPQASPPRQMTPQSEDAPPPAAPLDVAVTPDVPSVWDARPAGEGGERA